MRKIIKNIPNTITSLNLLSGFLGVILTLKGAIEPAFILMLFAALFDFCDGLAARLLNAYSDIGKELDSLADLVSFGVLPASMLFQLMFTSVAEGNLSGKMWLCFFPLLIAVFSALRLAKFNLDTRQHESFIGLATPSSAMICGSIAYFVTRHPDTFLSYWCQGCVFIPLLSIILCALLVSEIPMFAMKFGTGKETDYLTKIKRIAFLTCIAIIAIVVLCFRLDWSLIILCTFLVYILMNLLYLIFPSTKS